MSVLAFETGLVIKSLNWNMSNKEADYIKANLFPSSSFAASTHLEKEVLNLTAHVITIYRKGLSYSALVYVKVLFLPAC